MSAKERAAALLTSIHARGGTTRKVGGALCITPPELAEEFRPQIAGCRDAFLALHEPIPDDEFESTVLRIFGGRFVRDDTGHEHLDGDLRERLRCAAGLLDYRDSEGRSAFITSMIDAHLIGLRHRAGVPEADEMLRRLRDAGKTALTATKPGRKT